MKLYRFLKWFYVSQFYQQSTAFIPLRENCQSKRAGSEFALLAFKPSIFIISELFQRHLCFCFALINLRRKNVGVVIEHFHSFFIVIVIVKVLPFINNQDVESMLSCNLIKSKIISLMPHTMQAKSLRLLQKVFYYL